MTRGAVCLFFIALLHNGITKFSQANETSTDSISKNDEEITTKPTEVKPVKESEVPSKLEADEKSGVSSKAEPKIEEASDVPEKKRDKPEEKEAKAESKKEDVTVFGSSNNRNFFPDILKGGPVENANVFIEFSKNFAGPFNVVGAKIEDAFSKGMHTAKNLADGTFNFLRTSASSLFEK